MRRVSAFSMVIIPHACVHICTYKLYMYTLEFHAYVIIQHINNATNTMLLTQRLHVQSQAIALQRM